MRWVRNGLVQAASTGMAAGTELSLQRLSLLWPRAQKEGIVTGSFKEIRPHIVGQFGRHGTRALDAEDGKTITEYVLAFLLGGLVRLAALQDSAFLRAMSDTYRQAQRQGLDQAAYTAKLERVAQRFGANGIGEADIGQGWLDSTILRPTFAIGEHEVNQSPFANQVEPYLEFVTVGDDKVRVNHQALNGFVARSSWAGWDRETLPPLGWNCRCRPIPVPWFIAETLGYRGDFPLGTAKLSAFRSMGGADKGFPRELFVIAA